MSEWKTSTEISDEFQVGEAKLVAFALRGNLPSRVEDGVRRFDPAAVERLFPRRGALALGARLASNFGTLGGFKLGTSADEANRHISRLPTRAPARVPTRAAG